MAKIRKEKFQMNGEHMRETDNTGPLELTLNYNVDEDCFEFTDEELERFFPEAKAFPDFSSCKSRKDALSVFKVWMSGNVTKKRMMSVDLRIGRNVLDKDEIDYHRLPKYLKEMVSVSSWSQSGLEISINRYIETRAGEAVAYISCGDDWKESYSKMYPGRDKIFDWDAETEEFLVRMQQELTKLSANVVNFFKAKDIDSFKQKIKTANLPAIEYSGSGEEKLKK